jgi:hypothetical protein
LRDYVKSKSIEGVDVFVYDIKEILFENKSSVVMFGKLMINDDSVSMSVIVKDPPKTLYFFPKRNVKLSKVKREVRDLFSKTQGHMRFREVNKKYVFEMDIDYR